MKIDSQISTKLTNLMFVATLLIVLKHLPLAGAIAIKPVSVVSELAVPIFFAISGFLLSKRIAMPNWYLPLLKKRFFTLVIPYFMINLLYVPSLIVYHNFLHLGTWSGDGLQFNWYTISRVFGLSTYFNPACGPIWYIRCLIMFLIISPVFVFFIKKSKLCTMCLCATLFLLVSCLEPVCYQHDLASVIYSFFSLRGLVFFVIGIAYGFWLEAFKSSMLKAITVLSCAALLTIINARFNCSAVSLLSWVLYAYAAWLLIPSSKLPTWLTASNFAIYSLHILVYWTFAAILRFCGMSAVFANSCYLWLLPLILTLSICYSCTYLIRNHAPWIGKVFFGGRC